MEYDGSWKNFFADPSRYADAINGFGCGGEQIVSAEDLEEVDTQMVGLRMPGFVNKITKARSWRQPKFKDMARKVAFGVNFAIVGLESQETIDYSLPLRKMIYEVAEYEKQAAKIRKQVRKNAKGLSKGEYLYGFRKDSKLFPATTFILYSGIEEWQGPNCLHDMLDFTDIPDSFRKLVSDYKIHVINIRKIEDTSIFKTDLKNVLDFMRCAEDKTKLEELIQHDSYYQNMEEDTYDVVMRYANVSEELRTKKYYTEEGKVDMCKGLRDWMEDERAEGRAEGKAEGRAEGKAEGRAEGIIKTARKYHASDEEIVEQLMEEVDIDESVARQLLKKQNI